MNNVNNNIGCNVSECKYHAKTSEYCTLNKIQVVKHGNVNTVQDTDCGSFMRS